MRYSRALFALVAAVAVAGCGGESLTPVTGTVHYKGQPLKEGSITFLPEKGRPATGKIVDGQIVEVTTNQANDGVPAGKHKVTITSIEGGKDMYAPTKSRIPEKYAVAEQSGLTADIGPGKNELKFDLK